MYNTNLPLRAELPSTKRLIRSTVIAILAAAAILVTVILPAEYAIDPTGIGRLLGLAEMGEIKAQLAKEAEKDRQRDQEMAPNPERSSSIWRITGSLLIASAQAQPASTARKDEMSLTLQPGQGAEVKLVMRQGMTTNYSWTATGEVNYDLHGDGVGKETSYKKGRGVAKDEGSFTAAFDGNHGWFWRNRTREPVTVLLKVSGPHSEMKRVL